jgi:hypothetical protein
MNFSYQKIETLSSALLFPKSVQNQSLSIILIYGDCGCTLRKPKPAFRWEAWLIEDSDTFLIYSPGYSARGATFSFLRL